MTELELKIYDIVRSIPKGQVMTYGQVAALAGDRHLARMVGNTLHKNPVPYWELARQVGFDAPEPGSEWRGFAPVPCHRVINASGRMAVNFGLGGPLIQKKMLEAEGVKIQYGLQIR